MKVFLNGRSHGRPRTRLGVCASDDEEPSDREIVQESDGCHCCGYETASDQAGSGPESRGFIP